MDGYHFDNAVLAERGRLARKGAPETFDVDGLARDLARIRAGGRPGGGAGLRPRRSTSPGPARGSIAPEAAAGPGRGQLPPARRRALGRARGFFDRTLMLEVPEPELRRRLIARWLPHGLDPAAAEARAEGNDLPNGLLVAGASRPADTVWNAAG